MFGLLGNGFLDDGAPAVAAAAAPAPFVQQQGSRFRGAGGIGLLHRPAHVSGGLLGDATYPTFDPFAFSAAQPAVRGRAPASAAAAAPVTFDAFSSSFTVNGSGPSAGGGIDGVSCSGLQDFGFNPSDIATLNDLSAFKIVSACLGLSVYFLVWPDTPIYLPVR